MVCLSAGENADIVLIFLSVPGENEISFFTEFFSFSRSLARGWQCAYLSVHHPRSCLLRDGTHLGVTQGSFHLLESPSAAMVGVP